MIKPATQIEVDVDDCIWLSGVSDDAIREAAENDLYGRLGLLVGPDTFGGDAAKIDYSSHIPSFCRWAADNGCFSRAGEFDESAWLSRLAWIVDNVDGAHDSCLFAVAPDVFDPVHQRGDAFATIERSLPVLPKIRELGLPAALVLQDDLHFCEDLIPWGEFDVAFIGGSDHFKLGAPSFVPGRGKRDQGNPHYRQAAGGGAADEETIRWARMIFACYENGVEVHVGRVNSAVRLAFSQAIGAASADGTFFARSGSRIGLPRVRRWFSRVYGD